MDNDRQRLGSWRDTVQAKASLLFQFAAGAGLAGTAPLDALGARKDNEREASQNGNREERRDEKNDDSGNGERDAEKQEQNQNRDDPKQNENRGDDVKAEDQQSNDNADKQERRDERNADNNATREESSNENERQVTRRQEADTASNNDDTERRSDRDVEELEQQNRNRDDEPAADDTVDEVPTTPVTPSNPNVTLDDVPDLSDADLVIEANPDVIASVSTNGGFAFARSGNVIAVSGPDGARIIQTDDPDAVSTPTPTPDEPPDDGGNNDMDFSS